MHGKVCDVTGATGALGEPAVVGLAKRGAATRQFFKRTRPAEASPYARDPQVQRRLWEVSETLAGLRSESGSP